MFSRRRRCIKKVENVEESKALLLDLPELLLESILERLPAKSLCRMGCVCTQLKKRCGSNHLWQNLLYEKWGKIAGRVAFAEWQKFLSRQDRHEEEQNIPAHKHLLGVSSLWMWPLSCILPISSPPSSSARTNHFKIHQKDSLMAWYSALESGSFWFPAQIYNRENGHVGFMLSCYDAEVNYNAALDSFRARYPPHGYRTAVIEEEVQWERVRSPPVDTAAHELHVSDCLDELRPGDHVEVQWRRNKDFPYGWWYGVVGHSEACERNYSCQCLADDILWLEFNQYTLGSRWRRAPIKRKTHSEEGNEAEGFYGGVRKLRSKEDISIWAKLWPSDILE